MRNRRRPYVRPHQAPRCPGGTLYTIRPGDTLYALAREFGTTVDAIIAANPGIDPRRLRVGEQICIPAAPRPRECPPGTTPYIIRAGDTLYGIAQRQGIPVEAILRANPGIDPRRLRIGQRICIPAAPGPPPAPVPRTCALVLRPRAEGPAPESGGVFWLRRGEGDEEDQGLIAATNLPDPETLGEERYTALISWGRTTFDVPLQPVPENEGTWAAAFTTSFPEEFFRLGDVTIFPGPVMGNTIENCR